MTQYILAGFIRQYMLYMTKAYNSFVAEKIDEFSSGENPLNCVSGIREFCYVVLIVSLLVVSLRNTSPQLT
jgi:hypothetical protein